ncbi:hypothetical protein [Psychrobacter faecalis]|jgi:hypothetical protein|uniref:hypothetical protein n=1 Tax=Psychrobacter faecalis TaxID=180588 RepID=UPI0028ABD774|nr:hypothetical protein [Psychrobacter faecalis]
MEDTMSSYSFSHQFYQRWTCAPDPVRASIIQELTDITTLLQHDTPFETFVFSTHDLDAHLDNLYENHEAEQAIAKAIAEKQAQERAAAEKERLEEEERVEKERVEKEKQAKAVADAKQKEEEALEAAAAKQEQQHDEQLDHKRATSVDDNDSSKNITSKNDTDAVEKLEATKTDATKTTADTDTDKKSIQETANVVNGANDHNMKTVIDKAVSDAAIPLSLKDTKLGASHPELIRELEMHVDDYLSEQMMQISENLKSWLRAELAQHLTEPDTTTTIKSNENIAKKNIH